MSTVELMIELAKLLATSGVTLVGVFASNNATKKLLSYRIEQLEKKQDKHNSLITRMFEAEKEIEVLHEKVDVANHRIEDLEKVS